MHVDRRQWVKEGISHTTLHVGGPVQGVPATRHAWACVGGVSESPPHGDDVGQGHSSSI